MNKQQAMIEALGRVVSLLRVNADNGMGDLFVGIEHDDEAVEKVAKATHEVADSLATRLRKLKAAAAARPPRKSRFAVGEVYTVRFRDTDTERWVEVKEVTWRASVDGGKDYWIGMEAVRTAARYGEWESNLEVLSRP